MEYDDDSRIVNFFSGLLLGAVIGASVALLTAPESGRRTRRRLKKVAGDLRETATDRWEELAEEMKGKVDDAIQGARQKFPT